MTGQPAHFNEFEPSHCEHLLHAFLFYSDLPDNRLSAFHASGQQRFGSLFVHAAGVPTIALSPFLTDPLLVLSFGVTLFPLGNGTVDSHRVEGSVVRFPVDVGDDVGVVVYSPDLLESIAVVDVDQVDAAFLCAAFLSRVGCC